MQLLPLDTGKKIVSIMMGQETAPVKNESKPKPVQKVEVEQAPANNIYEQHAVYEKPIERPQPQVEVHQASFQTLQDTGSRQAPKNIDLILDVPLEISVVLGRTKKSIKDILNLGTGSLVELNKLAEEPVEVLVNGKRVAYGEVVVVDENFGVRITSIVSNAERVKSLGQ
jgi:flagellar motor switch protein FliN/FliY